MDYIDYAEARVRGGLRLVLGAGGPGPWDEAAKGLFFVRGVPFQPVRHHTLGDNDELFEWTGVRNAPVAVYAQEKPRHSWIDLVYLAERLGSGPSLLPPGRDEQVVCIGLSHQVCGEDGLGWNRRLDIFGLLLAQAGGDRSKTILPPRAFADYRGTDDAIAAAPQRLIDILALFDARLARQDAAGSAYLVGERLTAADIHLATFLGMLDPLPDAVNPMPDFLRMLYSSGRPELRAAISGRLRAHRDRIYRDHLELPLRY